MDITSSGQKSIDPMTLSRQVAVMSVGQNVSRPDQQLPSVKGMRTKLGKLTFNKVTFDPMT